MNLVIGFGPNLDLALWPRAKPINNVKDTTSCKDIVDTVILRGIIIYMHTNYVPTNVAGTIVPANVVGTMVISSVVPIRLVETAVPASVVGTAVQASVVESTAIARFVPSKFVETAVPTIIVETAYYLKSCHLVRVNLSP